MFFDFVKKIFGSKTEREVKKLLPLVEEINTACSALEQLSDEDIKGKTAEFRERLKQGETLDDLMVEAFAVVKDTCRRLCGKTWKVRGIEQEWNMVPYDVQLVGGISLHQGSIAEMATGEGKTLVATMPLYLNALMGKGAHLITVNDYLAQRDAEWMGEIFRFLGLTVGVIITDMEPHLRRENYGCDITYGTNNEFGFDYLRDNMAITAQEVVQREHFYAIVDEVDSVLIDEARTPLIISGPVPHSSHKYYELKPAVDSLVKKQNMLINTKVSQAKSLLQKEKVSNDETYKAGELLLQAQRGGPKHKQLMKLIKEPEIKKLVTRVENDYMRDKKMNVVDENLFYVIDEKSNASDLMEKGREFLSPPDDPEYFTLPPLEELLSEIEGNESLAEEEKLKKKEHIIKNYGEKSERLHNINNLLKAYALFERDDEYIVQDNKVMIVDEFTGRLMPGRRFSDGLHQALEAKEGVRVEQETQTFASITLQNYFRMYEKLSGMTGTAVTEEHEFWEIYKLNVTEIPTNRPIQREDYHDAVYRTKREKYNAIVDEVMKFYKNKKPILVGTVSVEVSETLSRLLKRRNIPHNVLNAKYHQKEAEIVARAGQPGAVTIATNMAGRGTDIKLGVGVVEPFTMPDLKKSDKVYEFPGGLQIIGSERHESRRIDRQLRGRAGRQGDPGTSRFFVSLEDDLMRLFGSERYANVLSRIQLDEGERIEHPWISKSIERAQKMVENRNFEIRKHLLEYDNVMNQQRTIIYKKRKKILFSEDLDSFIIEMIKDVVWDKVDLYTDEKTYPEEWNLESLEMDFLNIFKIPLKIDLDQFEKITPEILAEKLIEQANHVFELYKKVIPDEKRVGFQRFILLRTIDDLWKSHLYGIDGLKDSVGLRAYGQKDPVIEYKKESYAMFEDLIRKIDEQALLNYFRLEIKVEKKPNQVHYEHEEVGQYDKSKLGSENRGQEQRQGEQPGKKRAPIRREQPKVGPNEPCPCGSGKKYKKCCGRII